LKILEFSKTLARANQTYDEGGLRVNGNCWNVYTVDTRTGHCYSATCWQIVDQKPFTLEGNGLELCCETDAV